MHALADQVAQGTITVLIEGETGVGKEVLAQRVHSRSPRRERPFLRVNCAALPEALLEAELFGYEKGAFTGAERAKPGLLETAHGGSVLLDEVGELPLVIQAKLLRVLEAREVIRLGDVQPRPIDVRFLAASNRDLATMVESGAFRADLYYRLNGVTLRLPPLRARRHQLVELAEEFVRATSAGLGRGSIELGAEAIATLQAHDWPGNIRELRNVIECAVLVCGAGPIEPRHLNLRPAAAKDPPPRCAERSPCWSGAGSRRRSPAAAGTRPAPPPCSACPAAR
ncbi:MAG: sigma 54-interacting transcriptional regulator [Myxococcales bacterium]|nr:sigma 54-interacting transcriptional regulator [Myxococcales bacterium]